MGPSSGTYYLQNLKTKHFLEGTTNANTGNYVRTTSNAKGATIFQVTESGGLYTISNRADALNVGLPVAADYLVWQRSGYKWSIIPQSEGVWNIRAPNENRYWRDEGNGWVVTPAGSTGDQNNWQFIAA